MDQCNRIKEAETNPYALDYLFCDKEAKTYLRGKIILTINGSV